MARIYFLQDTPHGDYEAQMQAVPGFEKADSNTDRYMVKYIYLLNNIILEMELSGARPRIASILQLKGGGKVIFKDEKHKVNFNYFKREAKKKDWSIIELNNCLAVIYLLSSHEFFRTKFEDIMHAHWIDLNAIKLNNVSEEIYDLYQAARYLYDGAKKITIDDLIEPEILDDTVMTLIVNSFIINKYGLFALNSQTIEAANSNCRRKQACLV